MRNKLNISVSCFRDCSTPDNPQTVNLLAWLTSDKYREKVETIRAETNKDERDKLKKALPAITPSGVFTYREAKSLVSHSGLIAFDIDFKDNQHISNYSELKQQLSKLRNVAYCGLSVSGAGFWGLIPITEPEKHKEHYAALCLDFKRLGINLDPTGADVCHLRIYSFDPEAYFNHSATPYNKTYIPRPAPPPRYATPTTGDNREKVETVINALTCDITGGYIQWRQIACALANEFGEGGRGYFHRVSLFHPKYNPQESDKIFSACLRHNYSQVTIASFFQIAADNGFRFKQYWQPYPKAKEHFNAIPQDRHLFYNEYQRLNAPCTFDEFEKYAIN